MLALVPSVGTKPERAVRAALLRLGERFDCNVEGLPGTPDIVLPGKRAVFVNGCFWHAHDCSKGKVRGAYWTERQARTVARDLETEAALLREGWSILTIWECETEDFNGLKKKLLSLIN